MKTIKFKKKLRFHKETIADLHSKEMEAAHGGRDAQIYYSLPDTCTRCFTQCPSGGVPCYNC